VQLPAVFRGLPRTYWILWLGTLVDRLGGFVLPFLTIYLTTQRRLPIDEAAAIVSLGGGGGLAGSLLGGVLADHLGRKQTLVAGMSMAAVTILVMGLLREPWAIAALWLAYGFASGAARPAMSALVADVVPAGDRLRAYGLLHWAVNIGFAVSPITAGFLARRTFTGLFLADGATTLLMVALIAARVPPAPPPPQSEPAWRGMTRVFRDRVFVGFVALMFLVGAVYMQVESTLPADMIAKGITTETYGLVIAVNGALVMLLSPLVAGTLAKADPVRVIAGAAVLTAAGFGLNAVVSTGPLYAAAVVVWTLGEIASTPATSAVIAGMAPPEQRGRYGATYTMSWNLARFLGPPAGGLVLARLGSATLWIGCAGVGLLAAAGHAALRGRVKARLAG